MLQFSNQNINELNQFKNEIKGLSINKIKILEKIKTSSGGASPTIENQVKVHYVGYLEDGTKFDSSIDRGSPITFELNQVIKGWQEALTQMSAGDKWKLQIPPQLGYGEQGAGERIPPNSTLIFEIELIEVI